MINRKNLQVYMGILATGMLLALNGCGDAEESTVDSGKAEQNITATETTSATEATKEVEQRVHTGERIEGCIIQEDEQYLYFCGGCRVSKVNKETGEETVLWENAQQVAREKEYLFSRGSGVLIEDTIYFIEAWYDENDNFQRALARVHTDGTGYERIEEMKYTSDDIMLWQDGVLYVDDMDQEILITLGQNGAIVEKKLQERPYQEKIYYSDNGGKMLFEQTSLIEFGSYLKQTDDGYVFSVQPDTDEKEYLNEWVFFEGYNEEYILKTTYKDGMTLHLIDRTTGEERTLLSQEDFYCILAMDEEYVYFVRNLYVDDVCTYSYERISLANGQMEQLFEREESQLLKVSSEILMDTVIRDGYIYYIGEQDYVFYRYRRELESPENIEIIGDDVYDSGIAKIGNVQTKKESMFSEKEPDTALYNVELSWLVVDDKYPGSNLINTYLFEHQESNSSYSREQYECMVEEMWDGGTSAFGSTFSGFSYVDSHYISFIQQEYEYQAGAAHGMPWWIGFTFDLESGERMLLSDIVYNSEEELKEMVSGHFAEMVVSQGEGYYWEDAATYVEESVTMESEFYLSEAGVVFFYGPYELACYAAGFQEVTIPYEELDLRIILDNIQ